MKITTSTDISFLDKAIEIASKNIDNGGGPFGAIIVRNNEIIAEAGNSVTMHFDPTAHAEINAIRKACKKLGKHTLEDCVIYSSCEPCPMCLSAIYWARISKIYFAAKKTEAEKAGFIDNFIYKEISLSYNDRSIPTINIETPNSNTPFKKWLSIDEKKEY